MVKFTMLPISPSMLLQSQAQMSAVSFVPEGGGMNASSKGRRL